MNYKLLLFVIGALMICIAYQTGAQEFITDGLVSFWTFDRDDIRGDEVKDVLGNNNGKMVDTKIVEGKIHEALEFNGSSSLVSIPDNPSLELVDAITVEAWIYLSVWQVPDRHSIITKYDQNQTKRYVQFAVKQDVGLSVFLGHTKGTAYAQAQAGKQHPEWVKNWVHVAATWGKSDDGLLKLYVNGQEVGGYNPQEKWQDSLSPNDLPWTIGAMPNFNRFFNGRIDEARIYNRRLSDKEIEVNFNAKSNALPVRPAGKLAATWSVIKRDIYH